MALALALATALGAAEDEGLGFRYDGYRSDSGVRVSSPSVHAGVDLDRRTRLKAAYVVDAVSAASFDYGHSKTHASDPQRQQGSCYACHQGVDALSGATRSYQDTRHQVEVGLIRRVGEADAKLGYTRSSENDYLSESVALGGSMSFFARNTTLSLGFVRMADSITPTWARASSRSLYTTGADLGLTQVLAAHTQAKLGLSWADAQGFLSDPYAFVLVGANTQAPLSASAPPERQRLVATAVLKQALPLNSALELGYRYYQDSWDVKAHTLDLGLGFGLGDWLLEPSYRWYSQGPAHFFQNFYAAPQPYLTRDLKLAGHSSQLLGLSLGGPLGENWSVELRYSRYQRMDGLDYRLYYAEGPASADLYQVGLTLH